jgi:hypothetical protein
MKINDIILSEGLTDTLGSLAYKATAGLMPGGKTAEARRIFVNTFERELDAARKSAAKSGVPLNVGTFLKTYMQKNGFSSAGYTKEIQRYAKTPADAIDKNKLANLMYMISNQQTAPADPANPNAAASANPATSANPAAAQQPSAPALQLSGTTQQILKLLQTVKARGNEDDLMQIALVSMNKLYRLDKKTYAALRQQIITGKKATTGTAAPAAPAKPRKPKAVNIDDNPNIVRGYNE